MNIKRIIGKYNKANLSIGVLGSHSALDVCYGAKLMGLQTVVISQKNREKTYSNYYKTKEEIGCVDRCIVLDKFKDILDNNIQNKLRRLNTIFIPHRSFEVYLGFNYKAIENNFKVPMFGNRHLLKIEERGIQPNQYNLLQEANIRIPKIFKNPKNIDRLCIIKVLEKNRRFERAFFLVENYKEYKKVVKEKMQNGTFTKAQLIESVIEEFITGVQVNFNFFYSRLKQQLELLGTDTRRQTNIEGLVKIPFIKQQAVLDKVALKYEEAGHIAVTVLESLLEKAFEIGEKFVKISKKFYPPGIIGPFALQAIITPGPPKKDIVVFDVSPRVPGSPGIFATPYSIYLYNKPVTVGERIAMEIKHALQKNQLKKILT